jgi:hypothetical protein
MPLNLASPGIVVKEIDLTFGRVVPSANKIAGLVAPFVKGPVDVPTLIENENDLLKNFGDPQTVDKHYENWLVASSYLAYGGSLKVVRADNTGLRNAFVGTASSIKIKSIDHYNELGYDENALTSTVFATKNPGSWGNGLKVAIIDARADQILSGINTSTIQIGYGVTQSVVGKPNPGAGTTSLLDGHLKGIITEIGSNTVSVKILTHVSGIGTETNVDYQQSGLWTFSNTGSVAIHTSGTLTSYASTSYTSSSDWYTAQTIGLTTTSSQSLPTSTISWSALGPKPGTSAYADARNSRFDEMHVVVIDSLGTLTGNAGTIVEKHLNLSKASDAQFSVGNASYWRKYLANSPASNYVFGLGGAAAGIVTTGYISGFTLTPDGNWDQDADNKVIFSSVGSVTYTLTGGKDYSGYSGIATSGSLTASLAELASGYDNFESTENQSIDFLLMGSAAYDLVTAQALANKLISVAELRKDCVAFISPYRSSSLTDTSTQTAVTVNSAENTTNNLINFYSSVASSSYAVFDSGYKYMYDRFSDTFRYVPLNGDLAGLCARNDINNFPWYSPAGTARGAILNAVKLAFNPTKSQRDRLYSNRINPVVFSPGAGIILFGDRTAFAKSSAFDRINVRRLFIYLENAISAAAKDQLFEFNDEITRTNFVNTVEPFLRDVQAKRGITDYVLVCDETNNTASVIDNNEFVADIYIKPARSINFIGLTFIATKTGVDFQEVIGNF